MLEAFTTMLRDFGVFSHDPKERWSLGGPSGLSLRSQDAVVGGSCLAGFFGSILFICRPGIYWFALVDRYVVWAVFVVAVVECVGVARVYGATKFAAELERDTERPVPAYFLFCWTYLTPALCAVLGAVSLQAAFSDVRYEGARATDAAKTVGLVLMVLPLVLMVAGAFDRRAGASNYCHVDKPAVEMAPVPDSSPNRARKRADSDVHNPVRAASDDVDRP